MYVRLASGERAQRPTGQRFSIGSSFLVNITLSRYANFYLYNIICPVRLSIANYSNSALSMSDVSK